MKFLSVTNGDAGHHEMGGGTLARRRFAETHGGLDLPVYFDGLPALDYILIGDFDVEPRTLVPTEALRTPGVLWA